MWPDPIQRVDLVNVAAQVDGLLAQLVAVQARLSAELLREMPKAEAEVLKPLGNIVAGEAAAASGVQQTLRKRIPEGREDELMLSLRTLANSNDVDLYSLIVSQLDHPDKPFDLDQLMEDLQSLFQKNQIGLRIRLL